MADGYMMPPPGGPSQMPMGAPQMPPGGPPMPGGPMPEGMPPQAPPEPPQPQTVHDVTISRTRKYGCARVENVPPEEFGITKRQRSVMLRDCDYCYHAVKRTEASLVADGFDEEQVKKLIDASNDAGDSSESQSRDTVAESSSEGQDHVNRATRQMTVVEHYIMLDYEQDGKPKRYRITTGGTEGEILKRKGKASIEPDRVRFAALTPFIMTHRFFGRSVADLVMDIQRINTALTRELLNNVYAGNNQRHEIAEENASKDTIDDYLNNKIGGIVRVKRTGGIVPLENVSMAGDILPVIEYMEKKREWRTGVSRQGQGLDPDSLQNIGERAILDQASAARAKTKLIARIFAETGIKEMFWLLHGTIRENASEAETVKLRGEWVPVDPREWQQRDDLTVNVGLGSGSKEYELAFLDKILTIQGEAIKTPKMKLAGPEQVYKTLGQMVKAGGLKSIEGYFTDPSKEPEPQPEPTPEEKKLQMEAEAKKMELQFKQAEAQQKGQLDQAKAQQDGQIAMAKLDREAQADSEKMQQEIILKREQMQGELQLKREQIIAEMALKREQLIAELALKRELGLEEIKLQKAQAKASGGSTSSVHVGGDPG